MNMKQVKRKRVLFVVWLVFFGSTWIIQAHQSTILDGTELKIALKKLLVLGSVLYVAAHPDDENTALLAYFSKEKLLRTGYLSLTRGGGGQNLIGSEQGEMLSVLRTQELLAARQVDGAEQFFTRAVDFGYSKTPQESISIWGRDEILYDLVWVIRRFRPDVIITRFPTSAGGHGHHIASAVLAVEAFQAAGDAARFPAQLKFAAVWKPKRILWNAWRPDLENRDPQQPKLLTLDLGKYNPLLGKSYTEIAALSRSMHKSQGFGSVPRRGEWLDHFEHLVGEPASCDLFEGVDLSWKRVAGSRGLQELLQQANDSFSPENPAKILPLLLAALKEMGKLPESYWTSRKKEELLAVIRSCAGLWLEAAADQYAVSPGGEVKVKVTLINRSPYPLTLERIEMMGGSMNMEVGEKLKYNQARTKEFSVRVNEDIPYSQPYWLRQEPLKGRYRIPDLCSTGLAKAPDLIKAKLTIGAAGQQLNFMVPVVYIWRDPVAGERSRSLEILPRVTVNFEGGIFYFPDQSAKRIGLRIQNGPEPVKGKINICLPPGWKASADILSFDLEKPFSGEDVSLQVLPPKDESSADMTINTLLEDKSTGYSQVRIDYPHVPIQTMLLPARARLVRVKLQKRGENLAYIMGSGDEIPKYLSQVGYRVKVLSGQEILQEDLSRYDAVILGIRAYNTRSILKSQSARLLDYVQGGGTLLVQYNVNRGLEVEQIGPYPFQISRERVTDEHAAITFLEPAHRLVNFPNKIVPADFENWVQERGIYFADQWDPRYQVLLSCHDEGEEPKAGGLLLATYGKGHFIYSGYSWFRQLPAGVPGALRLFVNMISLERQK